MFRRRYAMYILIVWVLLIQRVLSSGTNDYYDKDFCIGKANGLHADPEDCRAFYDCVKNKAHHRTGLPTGVMFDPQTKKYRHAGEVNCTIRKVYRELWSNVPGAEVADLESSTWYPCAPTKTEFIDTFCLYNLNYNKKFLDNYGQRLRSFFRAPETGYYTFQTSCDNACQLWMSDNELPSRKRLIVDQQKFTKLRSFDRRPDQSSKKIHLTENKLYYMELLHKERTGYDFMCAGVNFPKLKKERPVSSRHLVMERAELDLIGCNVGNGKAFENVKCVAQACESLQQKLQSFKNTMDAKTKTLKSVPSDQSHSSQLQIRQITKESVNIITGVLEDNKKEQWRQSNSTLAMQIAKVTESFGKELAGKWSNESSSVSSLAPNIALQASVLGDSYIFSAPKTDKNWQGIDDFLSIKMAGNSPQSKTKAFSIIYKGLHEMLPSTLMKVMKKNENEEGSYQLNSRIIGSLVIPHAENQNMDVRITLQHVKHKSNATFVPVCVWWDFTAGSTNSSGLWSTTGCELDGSASNVTHSRCKCNHLTNFAVLMKVKTDTTEMDRSHAVALEIITYVGCGLSLLGVALTILIISCLSGLRSERNLIHLNLSLAIGIFQIIFLAGIEATSNKVACTLVAVLLHYFLLVSFAWMLVEGVYLYIMVITVFESSKEQLRVYGACAYGLPGVVVLIAASIAHDGYGTDASCWLSVANGVIYAFVAPALVIILVNAVILGMVIREIIRIQTNGVSNSTKFDLVKSGIKSAVVLLPLLGITWLFGVLALDSKTIAFQYIFAICNSLQGFFIFILHCLLNSEIRKAMQRKREIWSSRRATLLSPSSLPASSATGAVSSEEATLPDVNMMSLSEDTHNSELPMNDVQVKSSHPNEENHNTDDQVDVKPNKAANDLRAPPAWLDKKINQSSSKAKLKPVTAPVNKKRKRHRNPREISKGKMNAAIQPAQEEEAPGSNVNT